MSQTNPQITPLHTLNPLNRFSDRAEDYVKYRPSYPTEAIDMILEGLRENSQLLAADIGAGTGISSRLFAMSVSYLPSEGLAYEKAIADLQELYQRFRDDQGFVYMIYRTSVHLGEAIVK